MLKKYITPNRIDHTVGINVGEKRIHINFAPRQNGQIRTGTFTTSDEEVQHALENHPDFGKKWVLVEEKKVVIIPKEEPKDPGIVYVPKEKVSHFQSAKKYLIDKGLATAGEIR
ncbi:MAG: hypothetical protein ABFD50_21005, partial [Smithella sp.]